MTSNTYPEETAAVRENRRRQHLHLIIAQILGAVAGAALFACACSYGDEATVEENAVLLAFLPLAMMILFRLVTRLFQILRVKLGRKLYDAITGRTYIAHRNILAVFLAYVIAAAAVSAGSGYIGSMAQFALLAEGVSAVTLWVRVAASCMMVLLTTVYLLYRDIHYVCTAGTGSMSLSIRKMYIIMMVVFAAVDVV